ncbi:hypothetical protein [Microbulbifer sp. JMSA008]|uniref:hypothetical protein n=1 Tax=Microbulbifer sp. JMSA008 TaxID=3243373 RepID=UPI00403979B0
MPMTAHIQQLHHVNNLCAGLEWVADCSSQLTRKALLQLISDEVGFVICAYEQKIPEGRSAFEEAD